MNEMRGQYPGHVGVEGININVQGNPGTKFYFNNGDYYPMNNDLISESHWGITRAYNYAQASIAVLPSRVQVIANIGMASIPSRQAVANMRPGQAVQGNINSFTYTVRNRFLRTLDGASQYSQQNAYKTNGGFVFYIDYSTLQGANEGFTVASRILYSASRIPSYHGYLWTGRMIGSFRI